MPSETTRDILHKEVGSLHEWLKLIWAEYLKWFTFFCTLNVAAIGALHFVDFSVRSYFEVVFLILNIGGVITSAFILYYTRSTSIRIAEVHVNLRATYSDECKVLIRG